MKIKTVKKLNLHELIKHVWEKDIEDTDFFSNEKLPSGQNVKLHVNPRDFDYGESGKKAGVSLKSHGFVVDDRYTFTVEVEEELTEDTILPGVSFVYYASITEQVKTSIFSSEQMPTINGITGRFSSTLPLAIYYKDIPIWTSEHGIPDEGVVGVGE